MILQNDNQAVSEGKNFNLFGLHLSPHLLLPLIFLLALALRLLYLDDVADLVVLRQPLVDAQAYDDWAVKIAGGDWVGSTVFYQDPLYPYLLAVFYAVIGRKLMWVYALQCVLGAAGVFPLYGLARRSLGDRRVGLLAALLWAGYKVEFFFDVQIEKASLTLFMMLTLLWLLAVLKDRPRFLTAALAGLNAGLLFMLRGNFFVVVPVLFVWLAYHRRMGRTGVSALLVMVLVCVLVPAATAVRNRLAGGEWVLTTAQGGVNFYVGNYRGNPWGVGQDPSWGRRTPVFEQDDFLAEAQRRTGKTAMTWSEMDRFWYGEGRREIAADPAATLARLGRKTLLVLNRHEIPDNLHYDFIQDYFSWMLKIPLPAFWLAGPLGLAGLALALRDRKGALLAWFTLSYYLSLLGFYVVDRYRIPLVPPLLCFAAYGLVSLRGLIATRDRKNLALYIAVLIVAGALAYPTYFRPNYDLAWQKMGHAYSREGNWPEAIKAYEKSLQINPEWAQSWLGLGMAYDATRRFNEAIAAYDKAVQYDPRHAGSHYLFGQALERAGLKDDALREYRAALELDPSLSEAAKALERLRKE